MRDPHSHMPFSRGFASLLSGLAVPALLMAQPTAAAAADPSAVTVSGGANLVSDYRFRGISLSGNDPAVQGTVTVTHSSGVYAGTWASSIEGGDLYGHTEVDLYAGWSGQTAAGFTLDTMLAYYTYPAGDGSSANYFEGTAKVGRSFGPLTGTIGTSYSWEQKALGGSDNLYLFGDAALPVARTPITLKGHFGYSDGALAPGGSYRDWSLGAEAKSGRFSGGLAYVDTDLARHAGGDPAIVVSVGAGF